MAVYCDPNMDWPKSKKWPYGSVSHMYADTPEELHELAAKIGLKRNWCSDITQPAAWLLHYDLNKNKRMQAIAAGAISVDFSHKKLFKRLD